MKNHLLLSISLMIMGISSLAAENNVPLDDLKPDQLFSFAQLAYERNDCVSTIDLLAKYLKRSSPSSEQRTKVLNVIGWCSLYLSEGSIISVVSGCCDPGFVPEDKYIENDYGKSMREFKEPLK